MIIRLDKERHMKVTLNALSTFEDMTGRPLWGIDAEGMTAKELQAFLYACLQAGGEELTYHEVGDLISLDNLAEVADEINKAIEQSMPKGTDKKK